MVCARKFATFIVLFLLIAHAKNVFAANDCVSNSLRGLLDQPASSRVGSAGSRDTNQFLDEFDQYLASRPAYLRDEIIRNADGTATLKIGYVSSNNPRLMAFMVRGVRSGAITRIDAGEIVGPQALDYLLSLRRIAPADRPLLVHGNITGAELANAANVLFARGRMSQLEYSRFERARREMGIDNGCRSVFGPLSSMMNCGRMHFALDLRDPSVVRYALDPIDISSGQLPAAVAPRARRGAFDNMMGPPRLDY